MRLATVQTSDGVRPCGVDLQSGIARFVDLRAFDSRSPGTTKEILAAEDGLKRAAAAFSAGVKNGAFLDGDLFAPVPSPGKVICIGLNYRDHAEESGMEIPDEPVVFSKFSSAITGPDATIILPAVCRQVDYEAELVVVIGMSGKNIPERDARDHVAGYMNGNDVSARDWQIGRPGGQWLMGKTADCFAPTGPWLVTADEIPDPHHLQITLRLNGETMQSSSTSELIFNVDQLVSHLSRFMTLESGDLIFTGTPPGVGMARNPPVFLQPGDDVEVEIQGLGILQNRVAS